MLRVTRPFDSAQGRLLRFLHGRVAMLPALLCLFPFEILWTGGCASVHRDSDSRHGRSKVPTLFSQRARKEGWGTRPGRPALVIRYTSGAEARVILMGLNGTSELVPFPQGTRNMTFRWLIVMGLAPT